MNYSSEELPRADKDVDLENLPSSMDTAKAAPDEETPSIIGQSPDIFNTPKPVTPDPIEHPAKEDEFMEDMPLQNDGLIP